MATQDNVLRLLIVEASLNDAEMLISVLRNAGHAVRPTRVEDDEDLQEALDGKTYDLFLYSLGVQTLPLNLAVKAIQQSGKDIPIVAVAPDDHPEQRREAMESGAVDMVAKSDLKHLQLVIRREIGHLNERRRLRRLESSLREVEKRCHVLLDSSRDAIAYVHEGMHIYANHAYLEKFGFGSMEDIEGEPLLNMAAPEDQARLREFLRSYQKDAESASAELEITMLANDDGRPIPVLMAFSPASIEGEPCTQILMRDKSSNQELEAQLDTLSKQDLLTGLYNRQYFMEQLEQTVARAVDDASTHALLYVQLDNLDAIRQTVGITAVDALISNVGGLVRREVGDATAARFADEAFSVLLSNQGVHEAVALGEALRHAVEELISETDGRTVTTTASIGITMIGERSTSAQIAVNEALQSAEQAAGAGGNRVHLHTSKEEKEESQAADWRAKIEEALANDKLFLVYQPVASLHGDPKERYEVRVRMRLDDSVVLPEEFVPKAEQGGLMPALDRWVVKASLRALAKRVGSGHDTILFLKLSGPSLADPKFVGFLSEQIKAANIPGERLVFQVNEPVAVTQLNQAKEMFRGLKMLRCGFCLDHFGSGLNPFQLVKHLPADYLKVDSTLTRNLSDNQENLESVKQLIGSAHSMEKKIIAGYLEDASSLALLWQLGTDFVQGYFLQEPEPEMHYDFSGMVI